MKILILDAETRAALAAIRSLGRAGHEVIAVSHSRRAVGFASRFTAMKLLGPSPKERGDIYRAFILEALQTSGAEVLLPITDLTLGVILEDERTFRQRCLLPFLPQQTFQQISDKYQLMKLAGALGVNVPRSVEITTSMMETPRDLAAAVQAVRFPAVARPLKATIRVNDHLVKPNVKYLPTPQDAFQFFKGVRGSVLRDVPHFLQQRVLGRRVGVFALCYRGEPLMTFAHRRILENPPSGGVSVLSESIPLEEAPVGPALQLLRALEWDGIASVEFTEAGDGETYLGEIDPSFWGSIQLAIDCGRDFPKHLVSLVSCRDGAAIEEFARALANLPPYKSGQRLRWGLGCFDHALARMKEDPKTGVGDILKRNALLLGRRFRETKLEVLRLNDYRPGIVEFENWIGSLFRRAG